MSQGWIFIKTNRFQLFFYFLFHGGHIKTVLETFCYAFSYLFLDLKCLLNTDCIVLPSFQIQKFNLKI